MTLLSSTVSAWQQALATQYNNIRNDVINRWFIGEFKYFAWSTSPDPQWLVCDWSEIDRTTYAALFAVIWTTYWVWNGTSTFNLPPPGRVLVGKKSATSWGTATISNASPWVVTKTAHGLANGNQIYFTTTGWLPTGLTTSTKYFVKNATANTFEVSATLWGASINTSSAWSGTHTLYSANFDTVGQTGWEVNHTLSESEMPTHTHTIGTTTRITGTVASPYWVKSEQLLSGAAESTWSSGGGQSHNNLQEYVTALLLICADNT